MLKQEKKLKRRQHQQGQTRGIPPADTAAFRLQTFPLFHAEVFKTDTDAVEVEHIAVMNLRAAVVDKDVVDPDAAAGEHVVNTPLAQVVAPENGVGTGDLTLRNVDVGIRGAADDHLPVLNGKTVASVAEVGPGFRVVFFAQHGAQAAQQNGKGKQNQDCLAGRQCIGIKISLHANTSFAGEL